jgi:hypothetical protein
MKSTLNATSAIAAILVLAVVFALRAGTITVTNTKDSGPGSLRQALADANDGDTITFGITGTIGLTSGELLVDKNITISGPGVDNLSVDGNAKSRVFHIASGRTVTISALGVTNGNSTTQSGGGIYNDHATLALENCTISDNSAADGGGITNDGNAGTSSLHISGSTMSGNLCKGLGGGI